MKRRREAYRLGADAARSNGWYDARISPERRAAMLREAGFDPATDGGDSAHEFQRGWDHVAQRQRPDCVTHFRALGKAKLRGVTPHAALKLHNRRVRRREAEDAEQRRERWHGWVKHVIPLGGHRVPVREYTRAKNWRSDEPTAGPSFEYQTNCGRYSSQCNYTRYEYTQHVASWGVVVAGHLRAAIDTGAGVRTSLLRPWRGWRWTVDENGICLVDAHGGRDFHPTAACLLRNPSTREIAVHARANDARRREVARAERASVADIRRAEREGARVCVADSVHAGNCRAGTITWAQRHKLDVSRHYRPSQVLNAANGDIDRVQLVVALALKRHRAEMRQGYCEVADHRA